MNGLSISLNISLENDKDIEQFKEEFIEEVKDILEGKMSCFNAEIHRHSWDTVLYKWIE